MTNLARKLSGVITLLYVVKAITELVFWISSTYVSVKIWWWFSKSRELRHFKKTLKISNLPKNLYDSLVNEYRMALTSVFPQISLESMIKKLIKSR